VPLDEKGYGSLDVRLDERFSLVDKIKGSHTVSLVCEVFGVNRSSYKYWGGRSSQLSSEQVDLHSKVRAAFEESHGSAAARTIATIVTTRGTELSRYRASRLMKTLELVSCQLPAHKYKKASQESVAVPNTLGRSSVFFKVVVAFFHQATAVISSFSGFNATSPTGHQSRVLPDQRPGFLDLANS